MGEGEGERGREEERKKRILKTTWKKLFQNHTNRHSQEDITQASTNTEKYWAEKGEGVRNILKSAIN